MNWFIIILELFSWINYLKRSFDTSFMIWSRYEYWVRNNCAKKVRKIKLSHAVDDNNVYNDGTSDTKVIFSVYIWAAFINVVRRLGYWTDALTSLYMESIIAVVAMYQFNELVFATKNEKNDSYIFHPSFNLQHYILYIYR